MLKAIIGGLALAGLAVWWGKRAAAGIQDGIEGLTVDAGGSEQRDPSRSYRGGDADEDSIPNATPAF